MATTPTNPKRGEERGRPDPEVYDGIELTDEDLEVVVGGLSPEASMAHSRYLQDLLRRDG